jgi:hypothetical protein
MNAFMKFTGTPGRLPSTRILILRDDNARNAVRALYANAPVGRVEFMATAKKIMKDRELYWWRNPVT